MATDAIPFLIFSFSFAKPISHSVKVGFFIDLCQTFFFILIFQAVQKSCISSLLYRVYLVLPRAKIFRPFLFFSCPPTPPLTQQESIDNQLGLMLG